MTDRPRTTIDGEEWTRLARSVEVSARHGLRVTVDIEHDIALFRVDGVVKAVTNICPHKRAACLYDGLIEQGTVTCPMHAWRFDLTSGANLSGGGALRTYHVREAEGGVWVRSSEIEQ